MGFLSKLTGADSAKKAARIQADASDRAIQARREAEMRARADREPFTALGRDIAPTLLDFVKEGPETELTRSAGFNDIQRSAAARGKLSSGDTLEGLTTFNNRLNEQNRGNRFSELFNLATLGSNSAAGQANTSFLTGQGIAESEIGKGDALAAGEIASGNALTNFLGGISSFLGNVVPGGNTLLSLLKKKPKGQIPNSEAFP